jgi:hypothetical protein
MTIDISSIESSVQKILQGSLLGKNKLTKIEKLIIESIVDGLTYRQAGAKYQYTESSLQNAASRLFRELSTIMGMSVTRHNFLDLVSQRPPVAPTPETKNYQVVFDSLQANLWVREDRAQLVSIDYKSVQVLDMTEYLVKYSPRFRATFCLDIGHHNSSLELVESLYDALRVPLVATDIGSAISAALQSHSTLLILRFDRMEWNRSLDAQYAEIITRISLLDHPGCLLVINKEPEQYEVGLKHSLAHQLRWAIDQTILEKGVEPRLIVINNDAQVIYDVLQTYLK